MDLHVLISNMSIVCVPLPGPFPPRSFFSLSHNMDTCFGFVCARVCARVRLPFLIQENGSSHLYYTRIFRSHYMPNNFIFFLLLVARWWWYVFVMRRTEVDLNLCFRIYRNNNKSTSGSSKQKKNILYVLIGLDGTYEYINTVKLLKTNLKRKFIVCVIWRKYICQV